MELIRPALTVAEWIPMDDRQGKIKWAQPYYLPPVLSATSLVVTTLVTPGGNRTWDVCWKHSLCCWSWCLWHALSSDGIHSDHILQSTPKYTLKVPLTVDTTSPGVWATPCSTLTEIAVRHQAARQVCSDQLASQCLSSCLPVSIIFYCQVQPLSLLINNLLDGRGQLLPWGGEEEPHCIPWAVPESLGQEFLLSPCPSVCLPWHTASRKQILHWKWLPV